MLRNMASSVSRRLPTVAPTRSGETAADARDGCLDYDAWLLAPLPVGRAERALRVCSAALGPIAFAAFTVAMLPVLF